MTIGPEPSPNADHYRLVPLGGPFAGGNGEGEGEGEQEYVLRHVTQDDRNEEEWQQEEHIIIGRGRKVDYGTRVGISGTLTMQLYDIEGGPTAREQRQLLNYLKRYAIQTGTTLLLRTPFGDEYEVLPGNISFSPTPGVGTREFGQVTITYAETAP